MATLTINGQKVTVDDSFLSLPPEQQNATVDEIAQAIGGQPQQATADQPPSPAFQSAMQTGSNAAQRWQKPPMENNLATSTAATISGIVNGIPVLGPLAQNASDNLMGIGAQLTGGNYDQTVEGLKARRQQIAEAAPIADVAGNLGGAIGSFGLLGATQVGANALGMVGNLGTRVLNSGLSTLGLGAMDSMARGEAPADAVGQNLAPAAIASGIPVAGAVINQGIKAVGRKVQPLVGAVMDPIKEAQRRLGGAQMRDVAANPGLVLNQVDEAVAAANNVPLVNADRGGETVRALTRSVANQSPEARAVIDKTSSDRFASQADRAVQFVKRVVGGNVDDLGYQQTIKQAAQAVNDPAYKAAYSAPGAQAVWNAPIKELMQSDAFRAAINGAESMGTNKAAILGVKAVRNPFQFLPDGGVTLKTMPDGTRALPSLEFWNQVKRNLDGMIGVAQRNGDNVLTGDLTALKRKLVSSLDSAVPEYAIARQGAASFFGAEDALDAGKMFANQTRQIPEATKAFTAMTAAEKRAFQVGYASELVDKIKDARFRANVIDGTFGTPAKREMFDLVFGKAKARELEAYIRVEDLADKLRGALGNSTTARQLMELGIGAGSGFALTGGDWKGALTGAALAKGARYISTKADDRVMQEIARMLMSGDEALMRKAVGQASLSQVWMDSLDVLGKQLGAVSRGTNSALPKMAPALPAPVN